MGKSETEESVLISARSQDPSENPIGEFFGVAWGDAHMKYAPLILLALQQGGGAYRTELNFRGGVL